MVSKSANGKNDIFGMQLPKKAPTAVPVLLDFSTDLTNELDLTFVIEQGWVDFISGVFINNTSNEILTIQVQGGTNQTVPFPANTAGYVPLLFSNPPKVNITSPSVISGTIQALFYNVPMLPYLYPNNTPAGNTVDIVAIGGLPVTGPNLPVEFTGITFTDESLALTGGNDTAVAANGASRYLAVQNPLGNNPITVNIAGGDATASGIVLQAGGTLTLESGTSNTVNIAGTAAESVIVFAGA